MNFFIENIEIAIFLPVWCFLLITVARLLNIKQSRRLISLITILSTLAGLVFSFGCLSFLCKNSGYVYENTFNFIKINDFILNFGVIIDELSVYMLITVCIISLLVQLYSSSYMFKDESYPRFFAYLNLFNFSMLGLTLSPNLFQTYIFWELVGISSYLLIGFWYKKESASQAARKAFIMNRIGDVGLLIGFVAISSIMYNFSSTTSLATVPFVNIDDIANYLYSFTSNGSFIVICILLLLGSIAKSAQFPLHTWLPDAMEGPTPVSALIHSATMVAAGIYLIARLYPIYAQSSIVMSIIAIIGCVTALLCAIIAMNEYNFKKILAYSTSSQLGLMFIAIGCGAYSGAFSHLITHAFFKSMLFLCSGIVILSLNGLKDIRYMGGMRKKVPLCAICYLIGCVSISGILFGGNFSKNLILNQLFYSGNFIYWLIFLLVSFLTIFYMFKTYILVFEGRKHNELEVNKPSWILNLAILLLGVLNIVIASILNINFVDIFANNSVIIPQISNNLSHLSAYCVIIAGLIVVFMKYVLNYNLTAPKFINKLAENAFYIDEFYNYIFVRFFRLICSISAFFDKYIIDGFVNLNIYISRSFSWLFSKFQTGVFQSYFAYGILFIAIIFALLMVSYSLILHYGMIGG